MLVYQRVLGWVKAYEITIFGGIAIHEPIMNQLF
jgi:hypothetical protein